MFDSFLTTECVQISIYFWGPLMTRIIKMVIANGLPTTGKRQKVGIVL